MKLETRWQDVEYDEDVQIVRRKLMSSGPKEHNELLSAVLQQLANAVDTLFELVDPEGEGRERLQWEKEEAKAAEEAEEEGALGE